jgi:hypothetical protein
MTLPKQIEERSMNIQKITFGRSKPLWLLLLLLGGLQAQAQWSWSVDMSAGGAFSIIPGIANDSLISSPGYYAGIRSNLTGPNKGGWYLQPGIRSLAHSLEHEDRQFRRLYLETMFGYEWSPSFLNRSSIDIGADLAYLIRSIERGTALGGAGNLQFIEVNPAYRHFAEVYTNLNMELSEAISLQAGVHFSFLTKAESAELRGRPAHLSLGLRYRILEQGQTLINESQPKSSALYDEITDFKNQGVLLVQRIPYAKRSEFMDDKKYEIMRYRTDSANLWLQQAFEQIYTFSKVKYVDESEMEAVVSRQWDQTGTGFKQGEEPPYYVCLVGSYFYEVNRNVNSGLFVYSPDMRFKSLPFPGFSSFRSINQYFYNKDAINAMIAWFNKALYKYEAAAKPD